jgi:hypothetical protein
LRINKVTSILGGRGCGKSDYTRALVNKYRDIHPDTKTLIITDEHPIYSDLDFIDLELLPRWKGTGIYKIWGEPDEIFAEIAKSLYNCLIVFEDASKYINKTVQKSIRKIILDSKQRNTDLIFQFHGFSYVPPEFFRIMDNIVIFKTKDKPEYRINDIPNFEEVQKAYERVTASSDPHYCEVVKIY